MGLIRYNIVIGSGIDLIASSAMGDSESNPLSRSVHFESMCSAH